MKRWGSTRNRCAFFLSPIASYPETCCIGSLAMVHLHQNAGCAGVAGSGWAAGGAFRLHQLPPAAHNVAQLPSHVAARMLEQLRPFLSNLGGLDAALGSKQR